jgi:putative ABC transport system permease protein
VTLGRLVLRNMLRHPVRAALLFGFAMLSLFVGVFLRSIVTTLSEAVRNASTNRLTVQSAVSLFAELPAYYRDAIAQTPGVELVNRWSWFGGTYRDPSFFFPRMAVDMDVLFREYPEISVPAEQRAAVLEDRRACLIGVGLAEKFGFRIGDTIPIIGTTYTTSDGRPWEFVARGIYRSLDPSFNDKIMFLHWSFLEEVRRTMPDIMASPMGQTVTLFMLKVAPGSDPVAVASAVDRRYEAGPTRTHTQTEGAFRAERVGSLGNVTALLGWIGSAVVVAMLLSVGNAMGIAAAERSRDVGILKALGFPDATAARILLLESLAVVGTGGVAGALLAWATVPFFRKALVGMLPSYNVLPGSVLMGSGLALLLGLLGGLLPAIRMARVRPLHVLREDR